MKRWSLPHILFFGLIFGQLLFGQSLPTTNVEQLVNVIDSVWIACISEMNFEQDETIAIQGFITDDPASALVRRRLELAFFKNHIALWTDADSLPPDKYLYIDLLDASVSYLPGKRTRLFGKRWLHRYTKCHLSVQLQSQSGQFMFGNNYQKQNVDRIFYNQLSYLEQGGAILGCPVRPDNPGLLGRLEPWLMIGSISTIVYLFYIIRS